MMSRSILPSLLFFLLLEISNHHIVQSAPQHQHQQQIPPPSLDGFIKTNSSRPHHIRSNLNDHPDSSSSSRRHMHHETFVQTTTGGLKGRRRMVMGNKEVHVYYGVPFAEPPLGNLRFKKPVPVKPWNTTLSALHQPNTCVQEVVALFPGFKGEAMWLPNTEITEDCLYMNIWVPKPKKSNKKMSILVWIYGGGYVSGTATLDIYNAEILAVENNVIVVEPQYRVGAFGFLYFGQEDAPGNMGLYDQTAAIQWIKDNAEKFGGDPNSITIFGESAGGGSVTFHLMSPYSRHLIDRGIIQSGTINAPWSIMTAKRAREVAEKLVADCNCTKGTDGSLLSTQGKIECLRNVPAATISVQQWNSYKRILQFFSAPTIDGDFLPKDPMIMLQTGDFKKVPLLIGSNRDEGTYFIIYDYADNFTKDGDNCLPKDMLLDTINEVLGGLSTAQKEAIRFQYTHWEDVEDRCKVRDKFIEFVGDYYFICPTNRFAELYSSHGAPVYYYFFTQRTSSNPWGEWMGVMHADEIEYVFGLPLNNSQGHDHSTGEMELSRRIMKYFTRFADTGVECRSSSPLLPPDPPLQTKHHHPLNPRSSGSSSIPNTKAPSFGPSAGGVHSVTSPHFLSGQWKPVDGISEEWPLYTKAQPNYFILNAETRGTGKGPRSHTCAFWNEFLPIISVPANCQGSGRETSDGGIRISSSFFLLLTSIILVLSSSSSILTFDNRPS